MACVSWLIERSIDRGCCFDETTRGRPPWLPSSSPSQHAAAPPFRHRSNAPASPPSTAVSCGCVKGGPAALGWSGLAKQQEAAGSKRALVPLRRHRPHQPASKLVVDGGSCLLIHSSLLLLARCSAAGPDARTRGLRAERAQARARWAGGALRGQEKRPQKGPGALEGERPLGGG